MDRTVSETRTKRCRPGPALNATRRIRGIFGSAVPEDPGGEGKFVTREPIEVGVFTWARIQQLNDAYPAGLP
jgi:hypothetical protein